MKTKLTTDYMLKWFDFDVVTNLRSETINPMAAEILLDRIYMMTFALVRREDRRIVVPSQMENQLVTEEQKDIFMQAQAYICIHAFENGIADLVVPANYDINAKAWRYPKIAVELIHALGFNRPSIFTER